MKLFRNIASIGFIQVANYVFPMISVPIISRIIGPDKFGSINFTASYIAYFTLLIGFGFDLTATRKLAEDPFNEGKRNKVFSEVITCQAMLLVVAVVLFTISVNFIPQLKVDKELAMFTFLTCFATVLTQNWLFQAMQNLPTIAILNLISKVIFTVVVLLVVREKKDYIWQPLVLSSTQVFIALISFLWAVKKYNLRLHRVGIQNCLKLLWTEKIFFFSLCIINLYTNTNIVILGVMQNSRQVGYYTAGLKLISIAQMIISVPLSQALFPYVGKAFGESYSKGLEIVQKLLPVVFFVTFFMCVCTLLACPLFINIFYGSQFGPAILVARIASFIPMIIALEIVLGLHVMMNLKMDKEFFRVTSTGALLSIGMNLLFVHLLGDVGAALTWGLTELFNLIYFYNILKKKGIIVVNRRYFYLLFDRTYLKDLISGRAL